MRRIIPALLVFFAIFQSPQVEAQNLLTATDLSSVKVDLLSESDISKIKEQLQINNISIDQAESIALRKGMSPTEFAKLKTRLGGDRTPKKGNKANDADDTNKAEETRTQEDIEKKKPEDKKSNVEIFGSELFDNPTLNFEPNLKLATPVNYILGPGDELQISVYGIQEFNASIPVTVEGTVSIPYVGQIPVAGMTIEAATQKIKAAISRIYSTVRSGQSKVGVSLGRIRTIKVTLIGSKQPGNYSVSSLATVYNALFLGGGPAENGSYRNIELLRDNKVFKSIDVYSLIVNGDQSDNVGLKDNDVIRIPAYTNRVKITGQVNRPGIFEMKQGETFADLLSFASGFNDRAYRASVNIIQKTSKEFKVKDLKSSEFTSYRPLPGDSIKVAEILSRFENRIKIEGAVFRPDIYSFYEGMRISDLIAQADGLKEDAYTKRATIVRLKSDLTKEIMNVNLAQALAGDAVANIPMKREDEVTVYSILDFKEAHTVTINGEIKKPGEYEYRDNFTLNDLLVEAGGLLGSASKRVEVARMIQSEEIDDKNPKKAELYNLEINAASNEQSKNFELRPFDIINIRKMAVYEKPQVVSVKGSVAYPGMYVLANKNDKVYDIITRAGGLTPFADVNGVKIKRPIQAKQIEALESVNVNLGKDDTIQNKLKKKIKEEVKFSTIPIEWNEIVNNPSNNSNITLLPDDEIEVVVRNENVKVQGNVLLTSEIPYVRGKGFNYYLNAVGGTSDRAWKKKSYIIYPNGKASTTSSFLFFNFYPKVLAGSQIVIPEKPETSKITVGEIVSISSVLVGMAGIVIAIINANN